MKTISKRPLCFICLFTILVLLVACTDSREVAQTASEADDRLARPRDQEVVHNFTRLFQERKHDTWRKNRWLGVPTWQNPNDVWIVQEILSEQKPDFMIETGTQFGGSAILWAMVLREVNPNARVITIDIRDATKQARNRALFRERVDFMLGSSVDREIVAEIGKRVDGKKVVVLLDSNHSRKHVLAELRAYAPMVNVGSYIIVQDGILGNVIPSPAELEEGPREAIHEFLATNDDFEIDKSRERLLHNYALDGYLKRIQ